MTDPFRGFQEYRPGASRYNGRISEDEWNKHKPKLRDLHEAKLTRAQILEIISPDFEDVRPTYGQLCTKFDKWGFHVYRQNDRKDTTPGKKGQRKNTQNKNAPEQTPPQSQADLNIQQAFSPESSSGSTVVPDMSGLDLSDKATPRTIADFHGTPQTQFLDSSSFGGSTPRAGHSRNVSDQMLSPPVGYANDSSADYQIDDPNLYNYSSDTQQQDWAPGTSHSTSSISHGANRSSYSDTKSSRTSLYQTTSEIQNIEPDDPPTIAARTQKANEALDAVSLYVNSVGQRQMNGGDRIAMTSLAAYLFATRSYSSAFRIYHRIYDIMMTDMACDDVSKLGALMKCYQSAVEPSDLDFMQKELHHVLTWNFSDSSLGAFTAQMLASVETQISEGFNLAQGSILSTSSITRNLASIAIKGTESAYPGTRRLYWRLRLLKHSPFHSGCTRLLRLMSELLSWAWAAMAVIKFPEPAVQQSGCLCKDGMYFDFVRMVTTVILEAAMGFEIAQLIKLPRLNHTKCDCVMCKDLETTFEVCPIETFTAIALLTVDRCRLDWTSCHPGGRHQELTPSVILSQQLLPTIESLLDQVAADIRSPTTIDTSDLYDDFLSCAWSCFETHDLPLKNARFDASTEKVEDLMTQLITEELNKSHPARMSTIDEKTPVFTYGENNDELANKITAKRTRSNASALTKSSSNASERSMIRIRKKLKFRDSADYLKSMSSYSSLSSRNSMTNRFSYVTGLPELETVMDDEELRAQLPPDLTPDEFRSMQRHDSWSRRSDHFSWVPSRPGSTVSRNMSWRESNGINIGGVGSRPGSLNGAGGGVAKRTSQRDGASVTHQQAMQNSMVQAQSQQRQSTEQQHQQQQQQQQAVPQIQQDVYQNDIYAPPPNYQQPQTAYPPQSMAPQHPPKPQSYQPQYTTQAMPPPQNIPQHNQNAYNANNSTGSVASQTSATATSQATLQTPKKPERRDSNKTTSSKESQKGRWSSERKRIDKLLKAAQ